MAEQKRYYWLKLYDDFFNSLRIKKLRKIAGGDTYTIIYLKMQLKAMKKDGILSFTGVENDLAEELALDLDENVDDVRVTIQYLLGCGLAEASEDFSNLFLPYAVANVGSEGSSAKRVRNFRERQKALQCNISVTESQSQIQEIEKEIEIESDLHSICDRLSDEEWDALDNQFQDLNDLIDLIDGRLGLNISSVKNPYSYILKVAKDERWATK